MDCTFPKGGDARHPSAYALTLRNLRKITTSEGHPCISAGMLEPYAIAISRHHAYPNTWKSSLKNNTQFLYHGEDKQLLTPRASYVSRSTVQHLVLKSAADRYK